LEPGGKVSAQYASLPPNKAMHLTALRAAGDRQGVDMTFIVKRARAIYLMAVFR
jgi:hypothetical protein